MEQPQMVIPLMKMGLGMVTTNIYYLLAAIAFSINGIADMRNRRVYSFQSCLLIYLEFLSPISPCMYSRADIHISSN